MLLITISHLLTREPGVFVSLHKMDYRRDDHSLFRRWSYYPCIDAVEAIPVPDTDEVFHNIDKRLSVPALPLPSRNSSHLRNDVCIGHLVDESALPPPPPLAMDYERSVATVSPEPTERHQPSSSRSMECERTPNSVLGTTPPAPPPLPSSDADAVNPLVTITYASLGSTASSTNSSRLTESTSSQLSRQVSSGTATPAQVMRRGTELLMPPQEAPSRDIIGRRRSALIVPPQEAPSRDTVSPRMRVYKGAFHSSRSSASLAGSDCASSGVLVPGAGTYVGSPVPSHPDMISPFARDQKRSFSAKSVGSQASDIMSVPFSEDASSTSYTSSPALARGYKRGSSFSPHVSSSPRTSGSLQYSDVSTKNMSSPLARDYKRASFSSRSMASPVIPTAMMAVPFRADEDFDMSSPLARNCKSSFNSRSILSPVLPGTMYVPFAAEYMDTSSSPLARGDRKASFSSRSYRSMDSVGSEASIALASTSQASTLLHDSGPLTSTLHTSCPSLASVSQASTLQRTRSLASSTGSNSQAMSSLASTSTSQASRLPAALPFPADAVTNGPQIRPQRISWTSGTPLTRSGSNRVTYTTPSNKKKNIQKQPPATRAMPDSKISPLVSASDLSSFRPGPSVLNGTSPSPRQTQHPRAVARAVVSPRRPFQPPPSSRDFDRVTSSATRSTTNSTYEPPPSAASFSMPLPTPQVPSR